jgi:hypothetical protein
MVTHQKGKQVIKLLFFFFFGLLSYKDSRTFRLSARNVYQAIKPKLLVLQPSQKFVSVQVPLPIANGLGLQTMYQLNFPIASSHQLRSGIPVILLVVFIHLKKILLIIVEIFLQPLCGTGSNCFKFDFLNFTIHKYES